MNYYRSKFLSLAAIPASIALMLASCSNDEVEQLNTGSEIQFTSKVSRATVTNLSSLKEFYVYGQAEGSNSFFISNEPATQSENSTIYKLGSNYYWPTKDGKVSFWAFGAAGLAADQTGDKSVYKFNPNGKKIEDIVVPSETKDAGKKQADLVAAYTKTSRPDGGAVPLNFKHAFSQIEIKARTGNKSVQQVYVKGVWFMNIDSKATLNFSEGGDILWDIPSSSIKVPYGREFPIEEEQREKARALLLPSIAGSTNENLITNEHSMMLLPQVEPAYNFSARDNSGEAYILFLCRIISVHNGEVVEDFTNAMVDENDPNIHWHQLFPTNKDGTFVYGQYGYVCVPVDINWEPGKKYIYNIEFCGPTSGGGQYPPDGVKFPIDDDDDDEIEIIPRPEGKNPGDQVLDNPLTFKVTVEDWTEEPINTDMH